MIVEIQGQQYVLGVTASSINKICDLKNNIKKNNAAMPFDKVMKKFLRPVVSVPEIGQSQSKIQSDWPQSAQEK